MVGSFAEVESQGEGWIFQQEGSKGINQRVILDIPLGKTLRTMRSLWSSMECRAKAAGLGHKHGIHCPLTHSVAFKVPSLDAPWVGGWMESGRAPGNGLDGEQREGS